jgi:membrane protease YdiL (CAAX protease family)
MAQVETAAAPRPLWRRIVDFPLVAMVIGTVVFVLGVGVSGILAKFLVPSIPGFTFNMKLDLVALPIIVLLYWFVIARLGEHPHNDYRDPEALRHLSLGLAGGVLVFSVAVAIAGAMGIYRIVGVGDLKGLVEALIASAVFPAVSEEMLFRGILFRWLEEFGGSWVALLITSALFGAAHLANPNASWVAAVGIALEAGVMLGAAYMLTRSLWLPMGLHAAWNFTQGEIFDIPVSGTKVDGVVDAQISGPPLLSGNGFGLEASVIAIAVATLFGLWLLWLAIRKGEVRPPFWVKRKPADPVEEVFA